MSSSEVPSVIVATLLPESGVTGVHTHFNTFRRYLQRQRVQAGIATPFDAPRFIVYPLFGVRRLIDPLSGTASVWWYRFWHAALLKRSLRRILAGGRPCVVYAQCALSAEMALSVRSSERQHVVMAVHFNVSEAENWREKGAVDGDGWLARRMRIQEEKILPRLDGIVYVSNFARQVLHQRIPRLQQTRGAVIPNFCDPTPPAADDIEPVDIINIGSLEPRKNQQFLLHVIAEARRRGRNYTLALVGSGPDRERLQRLAESLGVADQVRFPGFVANAARLLRHARLYAHAATIENLCVAIIEALAAGVPVLAPRTGGNPDLIEDGRQGFFWPDDTGAAADLLIRVMEEPQLLAACSVAAKARYESHFATERVASRLLEFLHGARGNVVSPSS